MISVGNMSINVGATASQVPFTVSLSAATTNTVTVIYGESDGTATAASRALHAHLGHFGLQPRSDLEGCRRARCGHDCLQPGQRDLPIRDSRRD